MESKFGNFGWEEYLMKISEFDIYSRGEIEKIDLMFTKEIIEFSKIVKISNQWYLNC